MSDETANHRPDDQDPEIDSDDSTPAKAWDGESPAGTPVSDTPPF